MTVQEKGLVAAGGFEMNTIEKAIVVAKQFVDGGVAPDRMTAGGVVAIWQTGAEIGLSPMQALQGLTNFRGRIGIQGETACALIRSKGGPRIETRWVGGDPDKMPGDLEKWPLDFGAEAYAAVLDPISGKHKELSISYTVRDAKRQGTWNKKQDRGKSPWVSNPLRMLKWRAIGFLVKDHFSEYTKGLPIAEELEDYPDEAFHQAEKDITPEAAPDPLFGEHPAGEPAGAGGPDVGTEPPIEDAELVEPERRYSITEKGREHLAAVEPQDPIDPDDVPESAPPPEADEPQPLPPAEPPKLVLTPKPKAPSVKALHEVLAAIEHPMTPETVKKWTKEQKRAAWDWGWTFREWFEASVAKHPLADKGCALPKPSFIPEYGNLEPLGPQKAEGDAGDDGFGGDGTGPCGAVLDLTGVSCGLVEGHAGDHEPA